MNENKPEVRKEVAPPAASGIGQQSQLHGGSGSGGQGGRSHNNFCRTSIRAHTSWATVTKLTFKGDNATLSVFTFYSAESYRSNDFKTTTGRISGYVADKYDGGPDIRLVVPKLEKLTLTPPADPIWESIYILRIW